MMRSHLGLLLAIGMAMLFACAGVVLAQPAASDPASTPDLSSMEAGDPIPGHYIVAFDSSVEDPGALAERLSQRFGFEVRHVYRYALGGFAAEISREDVDVLRSNPLVSYVAQDRVAKATGQMVPPGIRRIDADQSTTLAGNGRGSVDADIAILDTGIYKHKDLNVTGGVDCSGKNTGNWSDGDGHGTHVSGTAAAKDNDFGVVGVAPGARLKAIKVLNNRGNGSFSDIICGIDWVTGKNTDGKSSNDIEVANMSLGGTGTDDGNCGNTNNDPLHRAICRSVAAGTFYAVAAGNDSVNFATQVPAAYDEVLTVTAMADFDGKPGGQATSICSGNSDDTFANFSNYTAIASPDVDHTIAAPGVCVRSTWNNGKYKTISGTSMATPHVTGAAALCITNGSCPRRDPQATMDQLRTDAAAQPSTYGFIGDPNSGGVANYYGYLIYAGGY